MSTNKITFILSFVLFLSVQLNAQQRSVTGKITTFDEYGLNNVSVTAKKSGTETLSNTDGYYTITCDENDKLVFEANGFYKERVKIRNKKNNVRNKQNIYAVRSTYF